MGGEKDLLAIGAQPTVQKME